MTLVLQTERLILREATVDDAPAYALGIGEYGVARYLTPVPYPYTLAMATDWLRQAPAATAERAMLLIELPGKGVIGCVTIIDELGYWIARRHWNRGYATEAARALIDWHFAGGSEEAVTSSAQNDNHASLAVLRKLGFVPTGREMRFSQALQHNVEHVVSRLGRHDWQEGRRR